MLLILYAIVEGYSFFLFPRVQGGSGKKIYFTEGRAIHFHFREVRFDPGILRYKECTVPYCSGLLSHQISIQLSICGMRWNELSRVEPGPKPGRPSGAVVQVQEAPPQSLVRIQTASHAAVIGSPIGRRTIGPASSSFVIN